MRSTRYQSDMAFYNLTTAAREVQDAHGLSLDHYMQVPQLFRKSAAYPDQEDFADRCKDLLDMVALTMIARRKEACWKVHQNESAIDAAKGRLVRLLERHTDITNAQDLVDKVAESMKPGIEQILTDPMPQRPVRSGGWARA